MNENTTQIILKALQALLQTSITPKEIPSNLKEKSWKLIDEKRRDYVNTIIEEIDKLGE